MVRLLIIDFKVEAIICIKVFYYYRDYYHSHMIKSACLCGEIRDVFKWFSETRLKTEILLAQFKNHSHPRSWMF